MKDHSTRKPRSRKRGPKFNPKKWPAGRPKKPYATYPLTPHFSGKWMKKIRGEVFYFGTWAKRIDGKLTRVEGDGWQDALAKYKECADDLHAGRTPRVRTDELQVKDLCNRFLMHKKNKMDAGKMTARMFDEYRQTTDRLTAQFGKYRRVDDLGPDDFEALHAQLEGQYGPVRLGNEIQKVRTVFKYGVDNGLIEKAVRFGSVFKKPSETELRLHRAKQGKRLFSADEVRRLIDAATVPVKAMIYLGLNCAFGNTDCGSLPLSAVDLDGGWIEFARPKTGIERKAKLWPETVQALRDAIAARPTPIDAADAGLVFITTWGQRWSTDAVTGETGKLLKALSINGRKGLCYYALRHTFRTVADSSKDVNAIRLVMGHTDDSIDATYTHGVDNSRLEAVAGHVRRWLFGEPDGGKETQPAGEAPAQQAPAPKLRIVG